MGLNPQNLGVQVHCLRHQLSSDFEGTLHRLAGLGFRAIELSSFPGCAGNPWGDFGDLAQRPPGRIREALETAGLDCVATHVMAHELLPDHFASTLDWVRGVGAPMMILAGLGNQRGLDRAAWRRAFEGLNRTGEQLAEHGLGFGYHTQNDIWRPVDGALPATDLLEIVDPALCAIELDPSGALVSGADWKRVVRQYPGRFFSMHLRDGIRPDGDVPYLPAVPLGEGDEDWPAAFAAVRLAGIDRFLLEMEVGPERDPWDALEVSRQFLHRGGWLRDDAARGAAA